MLTKFMLRPLPFTVLSPTRFLLKPSSPAKPLIFSLYYYYYSSSTASSSICAALNSSLDQSPSYGPSLLKGYKPSHLSEIPTGNGSQEALFEEEEEEDYVTDVESFTRVFDIAALRVPSEQCFALESRLRGHLLNWPRVRNIARVPGDEIEDEFKIFLKDQAISFSDGDEESLVSLNRRIYGKAEGDGELLSPVLYRDKLAKTFNSRGFVKFRNLAKLSRTKKGKKSNKRQKREKKGIGKNGLAVVEVVEESEEDGENLSGLLGDEFTGKKWRGSTRLLLLDERYSSKSLDELPEAIKVSVPTLGCQ